MSWNFQSSASICYDSQTSRKVSHTFFSRVVFKCDHPKLETLQLLKNNGGIVNYF